MLTLTPNGSLIPAFAARLGLRAGVTTPEAGFRYPAVYGSTGCLSGMLERHGGRWSAHSRCMAFKSWAALEDALRAVLAEQGEMAG